MVKEPPRATVASVAAIVPRLVQAAVPLPRLSAAAVAVIVPEAALVHALWRASVSPFAAESVARFSKATGLTVMMPGILPPASLEATRVDPWKISMADRSAEAFLATREARILPALSAVTVKSLASAL